MACCAKREKTDDSEPKYFSLFDTLLGTAPQEDASRSTTADEGDNEEAEVARSAKTLARHIAATGPDPNLLLYMVSDPPSTYSGSSAASSSSRKPRAFHIPPNTKEGVPIETEYFEGKVVLLYRPATIPDGAPLPDSHPYAGYFESRKRNWEFRVQGRFKRIPKGEVWMGVVLRDFNYDQAVAGHSKLVKNTGMALVKYDCYVSWGDRCEAAKKDNAELSHMVTDLSAWDQVIITPEGKCTPNLTGELQDVGEESGQNFLRKDMGVTQFAKSVREACKEMKTTDTFTMCFWGVSQVVDALNWQFRFGRWANFSMGGFFEGSPIHIAMYELEPPKDGEDAKRQLESRKRYFLDFMFWSNIVRCPTLADKYVFVSAPESLENYAADLCGAGDCLETFPSFHTADGGRRSNSNDVPAPVPSKASDRSWSTFLKEKLRWIPVSTCSLGSAPDDP